MTNITTPPKILPMKGSYFITVTLKPKLYKYPSTTQFEMTACQLEVYANQYATNFDILPELTNEGNIHYHGWLLFPDNLHKFKFQDKVKKDKNLGFIKINTEPIIDCQRVAEYMTKSFDITSKIVRSPKALHIKDCLTRLYEQIKPINTQTRVFDETTQKIYKKVSPEDAKQYICNKCHTNILDCCCAPCC